MKSKSKNIQTGPDLFASQEKDQKLRHIYTVSEITQDLKVILENTFASIWVEGEVSGLSRISTGTTFFNLKDNTSILKCVMFGSFAQALKFKLTDGIKVICSGHIGVYEKDGRYQLYTEKIEAKGIGSLQLALEQLKEKLEKEGLFSPEHKKPIPYLPSRIGVVSSIQGAAIKDILKVLDRRFKDAEIIINPVRVQGEGAKEEIAEAIKDFNRLNQQLPLSRRIEVMIVGRGGGSIEDLWAFNEEIVARAIYASKIPVISAVGHERDWTIADLVSDLRAATPSVAAELVIPKKEDLEEKIRELSDSLAKALSDLAVDYQQTLDDLAYRIGLTLGHVLELNTDHLKNINRRLSLLSPAVLIPRYNEQVITLSKQMRARMNSLFSLKEKEFSSVTGKFLSLNPLAILNRGFSVTMRQKDDEILKDAKSLKIGELIKTTLHKGKVISKVSEIEDN